MRRAVALWGGLLAVIALGRGELPKELPSAPMEPGLRGLVQKGAKRLEKEEGERPKAKLFQLSLHEHYPTLLVQYQALCGTAGCPAEIVFKRGGKWRKLMPLEFAWPEIKSQTVDGWHDFEARSHGSACCGSYSLYRWSPSRHAYSVIKTDTYVGDRLLSDIETEAARGATEARQGHDPRLSSQSVESLDEAIRYAGVHAPVSLLEDYGWILKAQGHSEAILDAGAESFPATGTLSVLLAWAYEAKHEALPRWQWLKRALSFADLKPPLRERIERELAAARPAFELEQKRELAKPALLQSELPVRMTLRLIKSDAGYEVQFVAAGELLDSLPLSVGRDSRAASLCAQAPLKVTFQWESEGAPRLGHFTLRWEKKGPSLEQVEEHHLISLDVPHARLRRVRGHGPGTVAFSHYQKEPFVLDRQILTKVAEAGGPDALPTLRLARCWYPSPEKLGEAAWEILSYDPSYSWYASKESSGALEQCESGPPGPLW